VRVVTFIVLPNPQLADSPMFWKFVSSLFFGLLYMVLMDALVLVVSALYNLFGNTMGMSGIRVEFDEEGAGAPPEA
jgi:hypothetical protein